MFLLVLSFRNYLLRLPSFRARNRSYCSSARSPKRTGDSIAEAASSKNAVKRGVSRNESFEMLGSRFPNNLAVLPNSPRASLHKVLGNSDSQAISMGDQTEVSFSCFPLSPLVQGVRLGNRSLSDVACYHSSHQ